MTTARSRVMGKIVSKSLQVDLDEHKRLHDHCRDVITALSGVMKVESECYLIPELREELEAAHKEYTEFSDHLIMKVKKLQRDNAYTILPKEFVDQCRKNTSQDFVSITTEQ